VVTDLHLDDPNDLLYAATYGRSSYKIDINSIILGLDSPQSSGITIYPNPVDTRLNLQVENVLIGASLTIYDALGRVVSEEVVTGWSQQLDVSGLPSGHYYIQIGKRPAEKFVVR
jgi:hypothetical protein